VLDIDMQVRFSPEFLKFIYYVENVLYDRVWELARDIFIIPMGEAVREEARRNLQAGDHIYTGVLYNSLQLYTMDPSALRKPPSHTTLVRVGVKPPGGIDIPGSTPGGAARYGPDIAEDPLVYSAHLEYGTKPGQRTMDPLEKSRLTYWARFRKLPPNAIIRAVEERGTRPHPYLEPAGSKVKAMWEGSGDVAALTIGAAIVREMLG